METRKVKLFGGKFDGLTIQAPQISGDVVIVNGEVYISLRRADNNGFYAYESVGEQ